jgi:hypothetical protein
VLHAFCGAGVDGEGHPVIGVTWIGETRAASPKMNSANFASYDFSEVCISATWCLVGQLDAAVGSHREGRVPRYLP